MKFTQLASSLKTEIGPVYLIEGDEVYFRDHAVKSIREACALMQPSLNDVRYEGEVLKGDKLVSFRDDLYAAPFFDEWRIARVYEFYPTERDYTGVLEKYVQSPCESTVLIIVNSGKKANTVDLKRKKGITYVDCGREEEEVLSRWLYGVMRRAGLSVDADAAGMMVSYCAQNAARMKSETDKLALLLGEGGRVTRKEVEEYVAKDTEYKIYELTQAASRGSYATFTEIMYDLLQKGFDENAILSSLTSHFKSLYECATMRGSDAEIAQALNMKPYPVKKNRELAARMGLARVKEYYNKLFALSCGAKNGTYTKNSALGVAVAKIFFG
ncbi:MAG: DNA polymerase III subunit delta [Clostridiales bacterium]|nr:DNA polymerase III subunit delta [Clostridiales bacterium]